MTNHAELFNTFLEAGKAMEELPKVRAEADELHTKVDELKTLNGSLEYTILERDDEIIRLKADLARREAELASATFRAEQSQKALDTIRGYLDFNSDRMGADVVEANAKAAGAGADFGQPKAVEIPDRFDDNGKPIAGAAEGGPEPKPEAKPETWWKKEQADNAEILAKTFPDEPAAAPLPSADSQGTTSGGETAADRHGYDVATPPVSEVAANPLPYAGRPHWQKPNTITWGDWQAKGGEVPHWYMKEDAYSY